MTASIWNPAGSYAPGQSSDTIAYNEGCAGSVTRTLTSKLQERVSIVDFGGIAGALDNTAAMTAAEVCLNLLGGGRIIIPYAGEWKMNWICLSNNIIVEGPGGKGEFDLYCIRPFDITKPAVTIGNGIVDVRYCGLINCHLSGTNQTVGAVTTAVGNAP